MTTYYCKMKLQELNTLKRNVMRGIATNVTLEDCDAKIVYYNDLLKNAIRIDSEKPKKVDYFSDNYKGAHSSMDRIFDAFNDYRLSQKWN